MEIKQTLSNSNKCGILLHILVLLIIHCAHSQEIAPLITPNRPDISVLPGDNVKFMCQSTEPIQWQSHKTFYGDREIHNSYNANRKYPYESSLELTQVDYSYVDYYYCVKNSSEADTNFEYLLTNKQASRVYLFVEDRRHPLVRVSIPALEGNLNDEIIVPCKPTSKAFEVQLIKEGRGRNGFEHTFTPTDGFRINLKSVSDGGRYTCHANFDKTERFDIYFTIQVNSGNGRWNKPKIESSFDDFGIEGDQMELHCIVDAVKGVKLEMKWELPNQNIAVDEGRVQLIPASYELHDSNSTLFKVVGKLIVEKLDKIKDAGIYKCNVADYGGKRISATRNVNRILGLEELHIDIVPLNDDSTLIVDTDQVEAIFTARYSGYPEPMLIWHDSYGKQIPWSTKNSNRTKFEAILDHQTQQTAVKIKKPQIADSGFYTLWADNGHVQKEHKFQLLVKDKPQLSLDDVYFNVGENVSLNCEIIGYPISIVTWSFTPCEKFNFDVFCDESKTISFDAELVKTLQKTPIKQTSELVFTPSGLGFVACEAFNTEGNSKAKANVITNDLDEDFAILTNNQLPISIGDDFSVTCVASAFKYSQVNWYKDEILVKNEMNVHIISNSTSYFHRKEIRFNWIAKGASGKYICRANMIGSENYVNNSWELDVMEPKEPEIIVTNIEPGVELMCSLGQSVDLLCKFHGIPSPRITWYKDENQIKPEVINKRILLNENNSVLTIRSTEESDDGTYKCVAENRVGLVARETKLKVSNMPSVSKALIFGVIVAILLLLICIVILYKRFRRERWQVRELRAKRLANMDIGNTANVYHDIRPSRPIPNVK